MEVEMETEGATQDSMENETNLLRWSKRQNKDGIGSREADLGSDYTQGGSQPEEGGKISYRDSVLGRGRSGYTEAFVVEDEGVLLDDDPLEEGDDGTWFAMGMTGGRKDRGKTAMAEQLYH